MYTLYTIHYTAQCFGHFCLHKIVSGWNDCGNCFMVPRWKLSIQLFLWMSRLLFSIGRKVGRWIAASLTQSIIAGPWIFYRAKQQQAVELYRKRANTNKEIAPPSNPCHILFYAVRGWDKWLDIFVQLVIHCDCNATAYNKKATPVRNCAGVEDLDI